MDFLTETKLELNEYQRPAILGRAHPVWKHLYIVDNQRVGCCNCMDTFKAPSSTTIALDHIRAKHTHTIWLQVKVEDREFKQLSNMNRKRTSAAMNGGSNVDVRPTKNVNPGVSEAGSSRQREIADALVGVLSIPAFPIHTLAHVNFQRFLECIGKKFKFPQNEEGLESLLLHVEEDLQKRLKLTLLNKSNRRLSLTYNGKMNNSFLIVSAHYIDDDGRLKNWFLGLVDMPKNLSEEPKISELLKKFDKNVENIYRILNDSGETFLETSRKPVDIFSDSFQEGEEDFSELTFHKPLSCFANDLSFVLENALKEHLSETDAYRNMTDLLEKCKTLPASVAGSLNTFTNLNDPLKFHADSCVEKIRRFLFAESEIILAADANRWPYPSAEEINFLRLLSSVLQPFQEVLKMCEVEKCIPISHCYTYVKALLAGVEESKTKGSPKIVGVCNSLHTLLISRFASMFDSENINYDSIYILASALDPNTVKTLTTGELDICYDLLEVLLPNSIDVNPKMEGVDEQEYKDEIPSTSIFAQLAKMENTQRLSTSTYNKSHSIRACFAKILAAKCSLANPIDSNQFWIQMLTTEHKVIAELALEILSVPATGTHIESQLSKEILVDIKTRDMRNSRILNAQLFTYINSPSLS